MPQTQIKPYLMPFLSRFLKSTVFLILICLKSSLFAQTNFYKFTVGGGYGATLTFPDTKTDIAFSSYGNLDYNLTPFTSLGVEVQMGRLSGGSEIYGFKNKYTTVTLNGKIHLGELLGKKAFNNFILNTFRGMYAGVGIGIIQNRVNATISPFPILNKDVVFPFNGGINFYFPNHWGYSRVILNLNAQASFFLEDGMDGDLSPYSNFNDIYNFASIGIKYNFGPLGLYQKR